MVTAARLKRHDHSIIKLKTGLDVPHQCALHTARQNKFDIRRHTERRRRSGSSVAVSQAGVKDLIAVKYSHR